jgi:hypothetical protein
LLNSSSDYWLGYHNIQYRIIIRSNALPYFIDHRREAHYGNKYLGQFSLMASSVAPSYSTGIHRKAWIETVGRLIYTRSSLDSLWTSLSTGSQLLETWSLGPNDETANAVLDQEGPNGDIIGSLSELYDFAAVAKVSFDEILTQYVSELNDATANSTLSNSSASLQKNGHKSSSLVTMPLKDEKAADKKAKEGIDQRSQSPRISRLMDVVRASLVCTSEQQILLVLDELISQRSADFEVVKVKNRFRQPTIAGYRDFLVYISVKLPIDIIMGQAQEMSNKSAEQSAALPHLHMTDGSLPLQDEVTSHKHVSSSENGRQSKAGSYCRFICELQLHHTDLLQFSTRRDVDSYHLYRFFRSYFHKAEPIGDIPIMLQKNDDRDSDRVESVATNLDDANAVAVSSLLVADEEMHHYDEMEVTSNDRKRPSSAQLSRSLVAVTITAAGTTSTTSTAAHTGTVTNINTDTDTSTAIDPRKALDTYADIADSAVWSVGDDWLNLRLRVLLKINQVTN